MARPQAPAVSIAAWDGTGWARHQDQVAAEEPLQLLLTGEPLSIVMRTPGNDVELALGLLWAERVVRSLADVESVKISAESDERSHAVPVSADLVESNQVDVRLRTRPGRRLERSFVSSSACGVCGATTLESLALDFPPVARGPAIEPAALPELPDRLRAAQSLFEHTGGLHAAGIFSPAGDLLALREDVGRHNAVDKAVGWALQEGLLPLDSYVLVVSGRAGYEVVQKAVAAGAPVVVAVGAPSSLAVATAQQFGVTLVGFARHRRFNVYSAPERLGAPESSSSSSRTSRM